MFKLLKILLTLIWKQRNFLFLTFILVLLLFALRFPWNNWLEKTVRNFQKKSPTSLQTDFDKLQLKLFPPGVEFKNMTLNYKGKTLLVHSFGIFIDFRHWLALKKSWKIQAVHEDSFLSVVFWKKEKNLKNDDPAGSVVIYFVQGSVPSLNLKILDNLFPNSEISGQTQIHFDYEGHPERIQEVSASLILKGKDIYLSKIELKTPLGPLSLPPIRWTESSGVFALKEGELVFKNILLGAPSDDLIVRMKGSSSVFFSYGRLRLNSYDIQLQIDLDKDFQMNLLDLMFAGYKEDRGSFYRYSLRMTGRGNQIPNMEKLLEF